MKYIYLIKGVNASQSANLRRSASYSLASSSFPDKPVQVFLCQVLSEPDFSS